MIMAYPFKAPNPDKVLGSQADMAELISLQYLHCMCESLRDVYSPGAEMIIAAVHQPNGFWFMKKREAVEVGAKLVYVDDQPSHYTLVGGRA